jgi:hypothetical protein
VVALGLVLLVLAVIVTVGLVFYNGESYGADFFFLSIENISIGGMVLAGVITGVVGTSGVALLLGGGARKRHKRSEHKKKHQAAAASGTSDDATTS